MNNFYEELKKYLEETPREKILEDWAKSAESDNVGPTVAEFLASTQCYSVCTHDQNEGSKQNILNNYSPEYTSGFFLTNNIAHYAKCRIFNN